MTKREFIGRCQCDYRFRQLLKMIETEPIDKVQMMHELNEQLTRSPRYQQLKEAFKRRLQ